MNWGGKIDNKKNRLIEFLNENQANKWLDLAKKKLRKGKSKKFNSF